ncbi:hypothetical protein SAMN05443287_1273 [Micromonospora phaseoli]|uniref:Uncharacterized protein n=1 Tax=Micromonospora phaseoli TaxID=1144548 RepID=A0A1H7E5N2_9ACTN|nr:hypothetical protein CLV64_1222 [Micromonospora phaseoli]SEK07372.1 hypothetical protein SAMN05443287_1273 [Micromonospora phaseoli]
MHLGRVGVLNAGESAVECHGTGFTLRQVDDILAQVEIVAGFLGSYAPDARQSLSRRDARPPVRPV